MRAYLVMILTAVMLTVAACGGSSSSLPDSVATLPDTTQASAPGTNAKPEPHAGDTSLAAGLANMPDPREVSASAAIDESTRSYLMQMGTFYSAQQGQGVETIFPEHYLKMQAMTPEVLAHDFAFIQRIRSQETRPGHISLDFSWEGEQPTGMYGLYLGYADMVEDHWEWRGPLQTSKDFADLTGLGFEPEEMEHSGETLVFVNYSDTPVVVKRVNFTATNSNDTAGDAMLYYVVDKGITEEIHRAPANELENTELILASLNYESFGRIEAVELDGQMQLVFNRFTQDCKWEVWQSDLDGSNAHVRHSTDTNIQLAAFSGDKTQEFCLVDEWIGNNKLKQLDAATGEMVEEYDLLTQRISNPLWYNEGGYQCRMLTYVPENTGYENWGLVSYISDDRLGDPKMYPMRQMTSGETIADPFIFHWAFSDLFQNEHILYSYKPTRDDEYSVVMFSANSIHATREQQFMSAEGHDLRCPQMSPDQLQFSVIATAPRWTKGTLYVMPAYVRSLDTGIAVAEDVTSTYWYDPTPPIWE